MAQAIASSEDGKVPIVFLKEKQKKLEDTLVIMRLDDLLKSISLDSIGADND